MTERQGKKEFEKNPALILTEFNNGNFSLVKTSPAVNLEICYS